MVVSLFWVGCDPRIISRDDEDVVPNGEICHARDKL